MTPTTSLIPGVRRELAWAEQHQARIYLTKEEVHLVLDSILNKRDWLLMNLLWCTGLRITEAISLKVGDVDFQNMILKVRWLKTRRKPRGGVKGQERMERYIPMAKDLAYQLSIYCSGKPQDELLFPITRQRAHKLVKGATTPHKFIKKVSPHTFRHSFAVHFLKSGGNVRSLQRLLGHAQITTTMVYLQIVQPDLKDEIDKVEW